MSASLIVMTSTEKCPICLDTFEASSPDDILGHSTEQKVDHAFHRTCITEWLALDHNTCPTCVRIFTDESFTLCGLPIPQSVAQVFQSVAQADDEDDDIALTYFGPGANAVLPEMRTFEQILTAFRSNPNAVTEAEHGSALWTAAVRGNSAIAQELLSRQVSEQRQKDLLITAISHHETAIAQLLITHREMGEARRGDLVSFAASLGNLETVRSLLASGPIPSHERYRAIKCACTCRLVSDPISGNQEMVELLLVNRRLPYDTLGQMVIKLAESARPNPEIMNVLLSKGYIEENDLNRAIAVARQNRNQEIAQLLEALIST